MRRSLVIVVASLLSFWPTGANRALAQTLGRGLSEGTTTAAQNCAALTQMNFEDLPGAPTKITSAHLEELTREMERQRGWLGKPEPNSLVVSRSLCLCAARKVTEAGTCFRDAGLFRCQPQKFFRAAKACCLLSDLKRFGGSAVRPPGAFRRRRRLSD